MDPIDKRTEPSSPVREGGSRAGSFRRLRFLAVAACLAAAATAAAGWRVTRPRGSEGSGPAAITVTETDTALRVSTPRLPAGAYSVVVRNEGTTSHELAIFR